MREPITAGKERSRDWRMAAKRAKNTHNIMKNKNNGHRETIQALYYTLELLGEAGVSRQSAAVCGVPYSKEKCVVQLDAARTADSRMETR